MKYNPNPVVPTFRKYIPDFIRIPDERRAAAISKARALQSEWRRSFYRKRLLYRLRHLPEYLCGLDDWEHWTPLRLEVKSYHNLWWKRRNRLIWQ